MKKIFTLSIAILLCIVAVSQSKYNFSFEETEYSFLETKVGYQILCKSLDYFFLSDTTSPALPYKSIYVLIPENVDIENISIEIESKEILKDVHLVNNLFEQPVSVSKTSNNSNIVSYKEKKYPSKNLQLETIMKMQDYYIAAFSACPFIYDAQNRSLNLITEMNLSFELNESITTKSTSLSEKRYDMESVVKSLVVNPNEINTLYSQIDKTSIKSTTSDSDVDYLIITDESLMGAFVPLKAWKIRKGINTVLLSTSYIYSNYTGTTNQLKIKKCLQDYYDNKNLKWALLGGDNTVVPVQGCYGKYSSYTDNTIPCDLFYACFDNTFDWDSDGDGIIGETTDNIDMAPEIYISRAPIRTEAHVNTFVDKVIGYETNPSSTSYVETMLLTGTNLFGSYNSAGESDAHWKNEDMYSNYISPQWSGIKTKFYDTGTDFTGGASYDLTSSNLQSTLNNGYHFVHMATRNIRKPGEVGNLKFSTFIKNFSGLTSWSFEIPASAYCQTLATRR